MPDIASVMAATSRVAQITNDLRLAESSFADLLQRAQAGVTPAAPIASPSPGGGLSPQLPVPAARWASELPDGGRKWAGAIERVAREKGLDPRLLAALVWAESAFNENAVSSAGATGLTQLMPGTAAGLGVDPRDPIQNLRGGAEYLKKQLDTFGSLDLALAAYNAGPGNVQKYGGIPPFAETQAYVQRVVSYYSQLGGR